MLNHPGKAGPTAAAKDRMPRPEWKHKQKRRWNDSIPRTFNYTNPTMCRLLKVTQFFRKGQFIIYARGWAGKNEGWVTSNSRQLEGGSSGNLPLSKPSPAPYVNSAHLKPRPTVRVSALISTTLKLLNNKDQDQILWARATEHPTQFHGHQPG